MCHSFRVIPLVLLLSLVIHGCSGNVRAPVVSGSEKIPSGKSAVPVTSATKPPVSVQTSVRQHVVVRGDTLYSIAFNYGLDYRDIAAWNGIRSPYTIYPGQKLKLTSATAVTGKQTAKPQAQPDRQSAQQAQARPQPQAKPLEPGPIVTRGTKENEQNVTSETQPSATGDTSVAASSDKTPEPVTRSTPVTAEKIKIATGPIKWSWPTQGKIVNSSTPISKNGIDIAGVRGQPVNAAAPGQVVYSGSGLLGYGRLIIIKHNENYLSAYAHNDELLVNEGDQVAAGQKIALMGQTVNGRTLLHFEIRKNGQPVNPLSYLPRL